MNVWDNVVFGFCSWKLVEVTLVFLVEEMLTIVCLVDFVKCCLG